MAAPLTATTAPTPARVSRCSIFDSADWKTTFGLDRSPLANIGRHVGTRLMGIAPEARAILVVCKPVAQDVVR